MKIFFRTEADFHNHSLAIIDQVYAMMKAGNDLKTIKSQIIDHIVSNTSVVDPEKIK